MEWKNIYRGIMMGSSDVVPGVSGGTIAVLLGFYDELIAAINGLFSREWKRHFGFLIPLATGVVIAIVSLSRVIEWLLEHFPDPTYIFFLGLILGILPSLFVEANVKINFRLHHYILMLIGIIIVASLRDPEHVQLIEERNLRTYSLFFASGFLGSAAMILPGLSGSFILLILGVYHTVISAVSNFEFSVIFVTAFGIIIGIITMSKIIHYFLKHYYTATFAAIIGLVIGSIFVVFPGIPEEGSMIFASLITFGLGILVAYILGKVERT